MNLVEWSEVLGNFGELFGAIAVVITVLFLTWQIRQNTHALRANAREFGAASYHVMATTIVPNAELGDLLARAQRADPSQFTPGERMRIGWFMVSSLKSAETQHVNWIDGMLAEDLYQPMLVGLESLMSSYPAYAPVVWRAARAQFSSSFQQVVDPIAESLSTGSEP